MSEIFYASVPEFYAAVEAAERPDLAEQPLIVGGDPAKNGRVQSVNAAARSAGIRVGIPIAEAHAELPNVAAFRTDMTRYRTIAEKLRSCLWRHVRLLEPDQISGFYFHRSAIVARPTERSASPAEVAQRLREAVREELGLELQVGAAAVKFVARLAAQEPGDEGFRIVSANRQAAFLAPLPVARLPGVGPKMRATLKAEFAVETVAELLSASSARLEASFGSHGLRVLELAHGRDPALVRGSGPPKSLSAVHSFRVPTDDPESIADALMLLARVLEGRIRLHGLQAKCIGVKVLFRDAVDPSDSDAPTGLEGSEHRHRSHTLRRSTVEADAIWRTAVRLFARTESRRRPVQRLSLSVSKLHLADATDRQLELFPGDS
jgi:DNA polymerase-4